MCTLRCVVYVENTEQCRKVLSIITLYSTTKYVTTTRVARHDMVVVLNLVQENEETEGKGNEEDGEKSQDGEERQKHLEIFSVVINVMKPGKAP